MFIKKLRRRFIILSTISIFVILVVVLGLLNILSIQTTYYEINAMLDYILQYDGQLPKTQIKPKDPDNIFNRRPHFNEETAFQIRYFTVVVDQNNNITSIEDSNIEAMTTAEISAHMKDIISNNVQSGIFTDEDQVYNYKSIKKEDGTTLIAALDSTHYWYSANLVIRQSLLLGLGSLVFFVIVLTFLSNLAIRPEIKNMENQKRFITNAGHELKTPLAIISANAEVLEMVNGKNEWTDSILNQTKRLSVLIGNLISLAKMDEKQDLVFSKINVSPIVSETVDGFKPLCETDGKSITSEIEEDVIIKTNEQIFRELVNILTDNAVKYCDDGGEVHVELSHSLGHLGAKLIVTNTYAEGKNVDTSKFFERFYREDTSHNSEKKGYGIGLSMAEEIVKQHKGHIKAEYKNGNISFIVTI